MEAIWRIIGEKEWSLSPAKEKHSNILSLSFTFWEATLPKWQDLNIWEIATQREHSGVAIEDGWLEFLAPKVQFEK